MHIHCVDCAQIAISQLFLAQPSLCSQAQPLSEVRHYVVVIMNGSFVCLWFVDGRPLEEPYLVSNKMTFLEHNPSQKHSVTPRGWGWQWMQNTWYGVCIYRGTTAVISVIFDKKMESILWCLKVMFRYLFEHTPYNVHIFSTPKKETTLEIDLISGPWATKPPTPRRKSSASTWSSLASKHIVSSSRRFVVSPGPSFLWFVWPPKRSCFFCIWQISQFNTFSHFAQNKR